MTLTGIAPSAWSAYVDGLKTKHQTTVNVSADPLKTGNSTGQINGHGVVIDYNYLATNQTLTLTVKHHPFWVTADHVTGSIASALKKSTPEPEPAAAKS